jgi:hypothetical protein
LLKIGLRHEKFVEKLSLHLKRRNQMLAVFNIRIKSVYNNNGSEGEAKFPVYNSQTEGIKFMPIMFKCVSQVASAVIASGVKEGIATGRLTTEPYESPSGKKRNRTVFVIEKFNILDNAVEVETVQPQVQPAQSKELEAVKAEVAATKAKTTSTKTTKAAKTAKTKKVVEVAHSIAPTYPVDNSGDDIPF